MWVPCLAPSRPSTLPPASALLAYWMGGAFLMAIKRLAEFHDAALNGELPNLARYRKSFASYSETRLLLSAFLYAQLAAFFLAVFLQDLAPLPLVFTFLLPCCRLEGFDGKITQKSTM